MSKRVAAGCGAGCCAFAETAIRKRMTNNNNAGGKVGLSIFILSLLCWMIALDYTTANLLRHQHYDRRVPVQFDAGNSESSPGERRSPRGVVAFRLLIRHAN